MATTRVTRRIEAPVERVFDTIADIRNYRNAVPDIVDVEFVGESQKGVGTKFRETRLMNGRRATVDLEVTELLENDRIRIVSDAGGTIWDSIFTVREAGGGTELNLTMESRPYRVFARITNLLIKGVLARALARDLDAVKAYCER